MKFLLILLALASLSWGRILHNINTWDQVWENSEEEDTKDSGSVEQDSRLQRVVIKLMDMLRSRQTTDEVTPTDLDHIMDVLQDLKDVYDDKIRKGGVPDVRFDMKNFFDKIMDLKKEYEDKKQTEGDLNTLPVDVQRTILKPYIDKLKDTMNTYIEDILKDTGDTGRYWGGSSLLQRIFNTLKDISRTDQDTSEEVGTQSDLENFFDKMKDLKETFEEKIRNSGVMDTRYDLKGFFDKMMGLKKVYEDKKQNDMAMGKQGEDKMELKPFFDTIKLLKNMYIGKSRPPSGYRRSELQRFFNDIGVLKKMHDDRIQKEVDTGRRPPGVGPSDLQRFFNDISLLKKIYDETKGHYVDFGKLVEGDNPDVTIITWKISPISDTV